MSKNVGVKSKNSQFGWKRKVRDYSFGLGSCCYVTFLISFVKQCASCPLFHDSAKGMIDCFCGMQVTTISNIITYFVLLHNFFQSLNSDWMYNDDSPKQYSFPSSVQLDEIWIFAFGTQLYVGSCFLKRIEKVTPALTHHLAKSEFTRHVLCLLIMQCSQLGCLLYFCSILAIL